MSAASQQQAQGVTQVSTAIQQMEKVTQTTAATAEESAAASEELNAQAETTMQVVRQMEVADCRNPREAAAGHVTPVPARRGVPGHTAWRGYVTPPDRPTGRETRPDWKSGATPVAQRDSAAARRRASAKCADEAGTLR